ncbi:GAF domain-containing protein [Streptomyces sp. NPDC059695]|uniref:GAF domain-containing protein n=1 Tax=Streptomyces sp. NPDC059695 TaxID=3346910 RepID=UPI0036CA6B37
MSATGRNDLDEEAELSDAWVAGEPRTGRAPTAYRGAGSAPVRGEERVRGQERVRDEEQVRGEEQVRHEEQVRDGKQVRDEEPRARRPRPLVAESWRRSVRARVSPDGAARVELDEDELAACREAHPLAGAMPVIRELMGAYATDGEHLLAVCDAAGRMLWVEGHPGTLRAAGRMNFVAGARWSEAAAGTNAPGTALAVDRPVQVVSAEHFRRPVRAWTCAAAPVHDPRSGRLLGAVDITGGEGLAHPHSLGFVQAVARAAESQLALLGPAPEPGRLRLSALGRDEAELSVGGRRLRLSRRHSEILVVLAHRPEGVGGDELLTLLYEDESVTPVTLRAELSRLRALLGPDVLRSRPYRLAGAVDADFATVDRRLASGAVAAAAGDYAGPLLPASAAPGVVRLRERLADRLRAALVDRRDPGLLADWAYSTWGEDDVVVWRALCGAVPADRLPPVRARLDSLEAELCAGATGLQRTGPHTRA